MFDVINVEVSSGEILETLGTKPKFWFSDPRLGRSLCKIVRPNTGEDWSEVVSAGIASLMQLPHAQYHLANYSGKRAVVSPSLVGETDTLVLGNELLVQIDKSYDVGAARFRQTAHTVTLVFSAIELLSQLSLPQDWPTPASIRTPAELFVGYLALDALVGNTDRHHENWGIIGSLEGPKIVVRLAPTFDHASSLGCHELDDQKARRLGSKDKNFTCAAFAARARSGFFRNPTDSRPMSPVDAFAEAGRRHPSAARHWIERMSSITEGDMAILLAAVPPDRVSQVSSQFAIELMLSNRDRIAAVGNTL
jgi:hypothetical protein